MAENQQQQQQQQQTDPAAAREFLAGFGHQPDALKTMADPDVLKLHETVNGTLAKVAPNVVPFGAKWREHIAGEDKDAMDTLGRFQDPKALYKSYQELRGKMAKGELKAQTPFPEKGTTEEQAAWRKENGVPEAPEKYDIKLDGNIVIGEDDQPVVQDFLKYAHGKNWNNAQAKDAMQWYFGVYQPQMQKVQAEADAEARKEAQAALASAWGPDFKKNMSAVGNFLQRAPEKLRGLLLSGRLADGTAIGDHPEVLRWFADMELTLNPHSTLTGPEGADALKNAEGRIKEIETLMRKDRAAYNKDAAMQEEYRNLLDARERMQQRGKAA